MRRSPSVSTGVCETTFSSWRWLQTSFSSGATLRSPTSTIRAPSPRRMASQSVSSANMSSLWRNLRIGVGVGNVAAGRDVEVVQLDPTRKRADRVPAVLDPAPMPAVALVQRQFREHGHAVIGFLAVHVQMVEAEFAAQLSRKPAVLDLDLLQAQHVRPDLGHDPAQGRPRATGWSWRSRW